MPLGLAAALYLLALGLTLIAGPLLARGGLAGIALAEWLFVALPPLIAAAVRQRGAVELHLARPRARALAGAALVGASAWIVVSALVLPLQQLIAPVPPELERALEHIANPAGAPWATLVALALTPAICEEILVRGAVLFALRARMSTAAALVASAALFGLLHLSPYRFLPTFALGLSFGGLALTSGSIVPSMLAHALNNTAIVLAGSPAAQPARRLLDDHPAVFTVGAVVLLTIGHVLAKSKE